MSADDGKLLDAIRLLAARPEVLQAAMEMARAPKAKPATVRELWAEFEPYGRRTVSSWSRHEINIGIIFRTRLSLDGWEGTIDELPWDQVTAELCNAYRAVREAAPNNRGGTIAPTTVNRELTCLRSCFNYHVRVTKRIGRDPMIGCFIANEEETARRGFLSPEQVERFVANAHPVFQDVVLVCYRCVGMRNSEARLLRKEEIDWDAGVIRLPVKRTKARRFRVVPFPDDIAAILRRRCEESRGPFVFVRPSDPLRTEPISQGTFQHWLVNARKKSGMHKIDGETTVVHHMRHSAVTRLVAEGAPEHAIKSAAGMSDRIFRRYAKWSPDQWETMRQRLNQQLERRRPAQKSAVAPIDEMVSKTK